MKRILALVMCLALMMTSFVVASADVDAILTVDIVEGPISAGEEVVIPVTITEWANAYATIELAFDYDETLLELDVIEQIGFGGAMSASNGNLFSLICNPASDRQANKLLGGEVCVAYFYAATDITTSTAVNVTATITGYAQGKDDNWTATQRLDVEIENGGIMVDGVWPPVEDKECTHEGGMATCCAKAVCALCGEEYGEVDATNHAGGTEIRNASETYTGDTYCLDCGKMIAKGEKIGTSLLGDVNGDGAVNTVDSMHISQYYVGLVVNINRDIADVNGDGRINAMDGMLISQYYVELINKFPVEGGSQGGGSSSPAPTPTPPATTVTGNAVVSSAVAAEGDEVTVTVSLGENTAIAAYGAKLVYDETALQLVSMCEGDFCDVVNADIGMAAGWDPENVTSGSLFEATFKILAVAGDYTVDVEFETISTANASSEYVAMNVTPGTISVRCEHAWNNGVVAKESTCTEAGEKVYTCTKCGETKIESIPETDHIVGDIQHDETHHWYECETVGCGVLVNVAPHQGGMATCSAKAVCSVCNVEYGEINPSNHIGGTATCTTKAVCELCGVEYGTINANNHVGETEIRNYVAEDCGNNGYSGDVWCLDCNQQIRSGYTVSATDIHVEKEVINFEFPDCGNKGYTGDVYCHDCGWIIESGIPIAETGKHTGGEATCCAKAVCDVCAQAYGDYDASNHAGGTEIRDKSLTYTGDTYCLGCGELIAQGKVIQSTYATGSAIVSNVSGKQGDEVTVTVSLGENTALGCFGAQLIYDSSALQLVSMAQGDFGNENGSFHVEVNPDIAVAGGYASNGDVFSGVLFTATFKILEERGTYTIDVEFDSESTTNAFAEYVEMNVTAGTVTVAPKYKTGDADGSGSINTVDAMLVSQYYAGYDVDIDPYSADVNGDGYANARDAMLICQYYVKLIDKFPVEY